MRNVDPGALLTVPVQPPLPGTVTFTNPRDLAITLADRRAFGLTFVYNLR